jgi:hypothetical protein
MEEPMSQSQHPITDIVWYSMSSDVEEPDLCAGLVDFLSNSLTI